MQRGKNKTCEAHLGGEEDKMSLASRWKENTNWGQRGWDAKLRDKTVTSWAERHKDQGKRFNMNMDKALSSTHSQISRSLWNLFLPVAIGRWKDCEAVWCQLSILICYQRCWEGLQLQEGRSDTCIAGGVWQRLETCSCSRSKSNITSARTLQPLLYCFPLATLCTACW